MFRAIAFVTVIVTLAGVSHATTAVDFEDLALPSADSFYNGSDLAGGFASRGVFFANDYNAAWGSWSGWSYSNVQDTTTPGFGNQYAAYPGAGFNGGDNYAIAYNPAAINLPSGASPLSVRVTNSTYAALDMRDGSAFSKAFGGILGDDPDYFSVVFTGYTGLDATGAVTGSVEFFLADYRFVDNAQDYIVDAWELVDLSPLGAAASIGLSWTSSDVGTFGINTPLTLALDNLAVIPEPGTAAMALAVGAALTLRRRGAVR